MERSVFAGSYLPMLVIQTDKNSLVIGDTAGRTILSLWHLVPPAISSDKK